MTATSKDENKLDEDLIIMYIINHFPLIVRDAIEKDSSFTDMVIEALKEADRANNVTISTASMTS